MKKTELSVAEKSFLKALLYFDIFNYPLTQEEIIKFSPSPFTSHSKEILDELLHHGLIFRMGEYYSMQNNFTLKERRINGNALAMKRMKSAQRFSKLVASFPFVKAVMLSGSISKGFMDEKSDIDFFIITQPDRLWIARAALAVFRRVFLFNSHRNLCTNYFIDTNNLAIPDRNYFTAIEFCTLVPMYGKETIVKFQAANDWVGSFLPVCNPKVFIHTDSDFWIKGIAEKIFPSQLASWLNEWLMDSTINYWKRKYAGPLTDSDFEVAFRSRPGVSKSHPQFFQRKVLDRLAQKIKTFEEEQGVDLHV